MRSGLSDHIPVYAALTKNIASFGEHHASKSLYTENPHLVREKRQEKPSRV
jgi:hypothetical protein